MIRQAHIEDIPRLAEIIIFGKRVAYRSIFDDDQVTFNELQVFQLAQNYYDNPTLLNDMLVYDDGIVKGVIHFKAEKDSLEISELYIEAFFKGNGIGKELIQYVINKAKMMDISKIFLWVIKDNVQARKFYEANGFSENGQVILIEGTDKFDVGYEMKLK